MNEGKKDLENQSQRAGDEEQKPNIQEGIQQPDQAMDKTEKKDDAIAKQEQEGKGDQSCA